MKWLLCFLLLYSSLANSGIFAKKYKTKILDHVPEIRENNEKSGSSEEVVKSLVEGEFVNKHIIQYAEGQDYLNAIKDRLIQSAAFDFAVDANVHLTFDSSYQAHVTSKNNNIFIPSSWIMVSNEENGISDDSLLAAVIAHELAHIILKHPSTVIERKKEVKTVTTFAGVAILGAILVNSSIKKNDGKLTFTANSDMKKKLTNTALIAVSLLEAKSAFINPRINRVQEQEADYLALDMVSEAGYDYDESLNEMFLHLKKDEDEKKRIEQEAIEAIKDKKNEFDDEAKKLLVSGHLDASLNHFIAGAISTGLNVVKQKTIDAYQRKKNSHFLASKREEKTKKYHNRVYLEQPELFFEESENTLNGNGDKQDKWLNIQREVSVIHNDFIALTEINSELDSAKSRADLDKIENKINAFTSGHVKSMKHLIKGKLRMKQTRYKDAIINFQKYVIDPYIDMEIIPPSDAYALLAETYILQSNLLKAQEIIDTASDIYASDDAFLIHKAMISCHQGEIDSFRSAIEQCGTSNNPLVSTPCQILNTQIEIELMKEEKTDWTKQCTLDVPFTMVDIQDKKHLNSLIAKKKKLEKNQ